MVTAQAFERRLARSARICGAKPVRSENSPDLIISCFHDGISCDRHHRWGTPIKLQNSELVRINQLVINFDSSLSVVTKPSINWTMNNLCIAAFGVPYTKVRFVGFGCLTHPFFPASCLIFLSSSWSRYNWATVLSSPQVFNVDRQTRSAEWGDHGSAACASHAPRSAGKRS